MGGCRLAVLLWSRGSVALTSCSTAINVFLTFAIALYGLCVYWWDHRRTARNWKNAACFPPSAYRVRRHPARPGVRQVQRRRLGHAHHFGAVIAACAAIRWHYDETREQLRKIDTLFSSRGPLKRSRTRRR